MQLLVVDPSTRPGLTSAAELLSHDGWSLSTATDYRTALDTARRGAVDAVILAAPVDGSNPATDRSDYDAFIRHLDTHRIVTLVLTDEPARVRTGTESLVAPVDRRISPAELRGRLAMIERYHGLLKRMERELEEMDRLGKRLNDHFRAVDQELRLAGRLQRDFLPDCSRPIGPARYASIFRPASWVSGDMFDVVRIDKDHTGIYIADAVGHGLAASLLTMFIKRAIVPKREADHGHTVLDPAEVLTVLNDVLAEQSLPNCQFVTACYAVLDHRTLTLRYARGGHPAPLHLAADGSSRRLETSGGLLGLFKGESFSEARLLLRPGDKVIFHTDGVELAFPNAAPLSPTSPAPQSSHVSPEYECAFQRCGRLPIEEMMTQLEEALNAGTGSLAPKDDVTILGMEILPP